MSRTQSKTWQSTRYRNIYRHQSGVYYVRISSGSKLSWRSLRTRVLEIAKSLAEEHLKAARAAEEVLEDSDPLSPSVTVGQLITIRLSRIDNDTSLKPRTKKYWHEIFEALLRSWPGLSGRLARSVKAHECERWARSLSMKFSATRFNNTITGFKHVFAIAVDHGIRHSNPASKLKRLKPSQKDLTARLPTRQQFHDWVTEIRKSPSRWGEACADFVEFLAYTGLRKGEARHVKWKHCDFERGELVVEGDPETGTKNRTSRRVPIIEPLEKLLESMRRRGRNLQPDDYVCEVNTAKDAMERAADLVGMAAITHHDLRHLFATTCIESGVDIPTVSKWLGHKDGGALAMKVYGHLRNEHSLSQAKKVSFS